MGVHLGEFGYSCGMKHLKIITEIMTDNIIAGHIGFLGISHNFWTTYVNINI